MKAKTITPYVVHYIRNYLDELLNEEHFLSEQIGKKISEEGWLGNLDSNQD